MQEARRDAFHSEWEQAHDAGAADKCGREWGGGERVCEGVKDGVAGHGSQLGL